MRRPKRDDTERAPHPCRVLGRCCLVAICVCLVWGLIYMPMKTGSSMHMPARLSWMIEQRDLSRFVHPDNNTLILKPLMNSENNSLLIVIVVCSAVPNFSSREAIRETWAQDTKTLKDIRVVFLLGTPLNKTLNSAVMKESMKYQDIIQQDFVDTYNNLTLKSVMLLKWFQQSDINAKYIMKTDDDMFVHIPNLVKLLKKKEQKRLLIGCLIQGAEPIKDWGSKWFVPDMVFSERTYPPYLSGTGYVMSSDVVPILFKTALDTSFFYLEDVFLTGFCARRAGLKPKNNEGFKYYKRKNDTCLFRHLITAHKMSVKELREMMNKIHNPSIKCKS